MVLYSAENAIRTGADMFALTKKSDYALIALSHMTRSGNPVCSAREVASLYNLSPALLMNVLKGLTRCGLVRSWRGAKGGYALAEDARDITLARVIEAVEGPVRVVRCKPRDQAASGQNCELAATCPLRSPVRRVQGKLEEFLSKITLAEIAMEWPELAPEGPLAAGAQV
jgi:Rrf2 family protein